MPYSIPLLMPLPGKPGFHYLNIKGAKDTVVMFFRDLGTPLRWNIVADNRHRINSLECVVFSLEDT